MRAPTRLAACLLAVLLAAPAHAADRAPADDYGRPHDLILAIDVSFSMTERFLGFLDPGKELPPSDPEGIRWDGVQFAIDVAHPQDRVALVAFRGEGIVLTRYLDPSGFVSLDDVRRYGGKTGREALRTLIAEVQGEEVKVAASNRDKSAQDPHPAQFDYNRLRTLPRPADDELVLWSGTSVVFALQKIEKELLPRTGGDRRGFVLLFTDGFETSPFDERDPRPTPREEARHEHRAADYDYVRELLAHKDDPARVEKMVDGWVKPFREKQVPVFTFGLGKDCYMPFLEMLSEQSSLPEAAVPAESNHALSNVDMFDQLRRVAWELQDYWYGPPEVLPRPDEKAFRTPPLGGWHDLGVLLFAQKPAADGQKAVAVAPESVTVRAVPGPPGPPALEVRTSRSHHYYYLAPDSPAKGALGPQALLEFGLKRSEHEPRCWVVLRTESPLFEYLKPETGAARYTPKDAIPFEVAFQPDAGGIFRPDHFQVQALVRPAVELARAGRRVPDAVRVPLVLTPAVVPGPDRRSVFRFEQDRGVPGLVLDPDPRSAGDRDLVGPYTVDVTIKGADKGPFEGYERRLIRRTIRVKDYPALKAGVDSVTLSNAADGSTGAAVPVELDLVTARTDEVATVTARVERGPALRGQGPLPAELFRWRHGKGLDAGNELRLSGPKGQFYLELPAERWTELVVGKYEGGVALVQAPWSREPARVKFDVVKTPYKVSARTPVLDLSQAGAEPLRQTIAATLETPLATRETVALVAEKGDSPDAAPRKVTFTAVKDRTEVELQVGELGRPATVAGGKFAASGGPALALTAPATSKLAPGRYRRTLWLTGPAVEPTPVTVEVVTDQPGVVVEGPDRVWIKGLDNAPRPQLELSLLGLAGTHVRRTVAFYSVEGGKTLPSRAALDALSPATGNDRLPVQVPDGTAERLDLDLAVPLEVEEGTYTSRLKLTDPSKQKPPAELLVRMQVVHYGIATEEPGPVRLKFAEPCAATASAAIKVVTPAEKVPVRWWVEQVDAAELDKDGHDGEVLPQGLLDVKAADGVSVLGQKPKEPLFRERPLPLTVEARSARLLPGLYRTKLRFHVREDDPRAEKEQGAPYDLDVTVVVAGRRVELLAPPDPRCRVGQDAERHVRVSCWDCEPDSGAWQALGDGGNATGPETRIQRLVKSEQDARIPGLRHHTFAFSVRPERAGKNSFRVTWPPCCRDNPSENSLTGAGQLNARGLIAVRPQFCYPGEQVTVEVLADPSSVPGSGLELEVVNRRKVDQAPTSLTLTPAGGGRFTAKHTLDEVGEYEVRLAAHGPAGLALDPVRESAAFSLNASAELGTIEYGGGSLASLFGSKQEVSVPGAVQLTNKEGRKCRWKARLRYPVSAAASRDLADRNNATLDPDETTSPHYDESKHLQTQLRDPTGAEAAEEGWVAAGTLDDDQTLALDIDSKLSEPAQELVWTGSHGHPTLNSRNGMMVEVALEWLDDAGQPVAQRTVYVPFVVGTGRGWTMWLLLGLIPVAVILGYFGWRWYRRRQRLRALRPAAGPGEEHLGPAPPARRGWLGGGREEKRPVAGSDDPGSGGGSGGRGPDDLGPPDTGGPPPGDDLLPDYLR